MVVNFWNINGKTLLKILPLGEHINSPTFIEKTFELLTRYPTFVEAKSSLEKVPLAF